MTATNIDFIVKNGLQLGSGALTTNGTAGSTGQVLTSQGSGTPPIWETLSGVSVISFQTSLSGLTPSSATTGAITLSGTLGATSGGTGSSSAPTSGQFLYSSGGTTYAPTTLSSQAVTTFSAGSTGLTPNTATSGVITLAGTLNIANGGTGQTSASTAFNALSPLTTAGDIIYYNGTTNTRLPIGSSGQVLTISSGEPAWASSSSIVSTKQVTTTYAILSTDGTIFANAASGAFTVTLPASPNAGETHTIKKVDSTRQAVTLSGNGNNIDNYSTVTMNVPYLSIDVQWNATSTVWQII